MVLNVSGEQEDVSRANHSPSRDCDDVSGNNNNNVTPSQRDVADAASSDRNGSEGSHVIRAAPMTQLRRHTSMKPKHRLMPAAHKQLLFKPESAAVTSQPLETMTSSAVEHDDSTANSGSSTPTAANRHTLMTSSQSEADIGSNNNNVTSSSRSDHSEHARNDDCDAPIDFSVKREFGDTNGRDDVSEASVEDYNYRGSTAARKYADDVINSGASAQNSDDDVARRSAELMQQRLREAMLESARRGDVTSDASALYERMTKLLHQQHQAASAAIRQQVPFPKDLKVGEPRLAMPQLPTPMTSPHRAMPPIRPFGHMGAGAGNLPLNLMANFGMLGSFPIRPPAAFDASKVERQIPESNTLNGTGSSHTRPFKAYPKDPLTLPLGYFGLPGVPPLPGIDNATAQAFTQMGTEELFKQYREMFVKRNEQDMRHMARNVKRKPATSSVTADDASSISSGSGGRLMPLSPNESTSSRENLSASTPEKCSPTPMLSPATPTGAHTQLSSSLQQPLWPKPEPVMPSSTATTTSEFESPKPSDASFSLAPSLPDSESDDVPSKKRSRSNSDGTVVKDDAYWERRRKNNEAAKRSRDSRRAKEDQIALRAACLEQENLKLRLEVTALRNETAKLRCMLYNS